MQPEPTVALDEAIEAAAPLLYEADRDKDETVPWGDFRPTDVASIVLASVSKIRATIAVRAAEPIIAAPIKAERDEARWAVAQLHDENERTIESQNYYRAMAVERGKLLEAAEAERDALRARLADAERDRDKARAALDEEMTTVANVLIALGLDESPDLADELIVERIEQLCDFRMNVVMALVIEDDDEERTDEQVVERVRELVANEMGAAQEIDAERHAAIAIERQRDQLERDIETIVADWHRQAADAERDALNRAADAFTEHYLSNVECDHERGMDRPWCACSLVDLGWHPSVGDAVKAWRDHVMSVLRERAKAVGNQPIPPSDTVTP